MHKSTYKWLLGVLALAVLASLRPLAAQAKPLAQSTNTPTFTLTPSQTPTRTLTLTPSLTFTPSRTPTRTNTPSPTYPPAYPTNFVPDTYAIQRGDTLSEIAKRFGLSLAALMAANNIQDANQIAVGQVLVIKNGTSTPPPPIVIIVKRGDSLGKIAKFYGITVGRLKLLNNLKNNTIFIGQRLIVWP
jgi:LysM repeat protein